MAVYTRISRVQLIDFLEDYDLGTLESFEGIIQGVSNTNYRVYTDQGRYILTLFDHEIDEDALPFIFSFQAHLKAHGINCPYPLLDHEDGIFNPLRSKQAVLVSYLDGKALSKEEITPDICTQLGTILGQMHRAALSFSMNHKNVRGLSYWNDLHQKTKNLSDKVAEGASELVARELVFLEKNWPKDLLSAAVHIDLFPDNAMGEDGQITGIIDFYISACDFLAYDLAIVVNAWCFDLDHRFQEDHYKALMGAYQKIRLLEENEKRAFPVLLRGASMRFLISRMRDRLFHDSKDFVKPHDPCEYIAKLKFHQSNELSVE